MFIKLLSSRTSFKLLISFGSFVKAIAFKVKKGNQSLLAYSDRTWTISRPTSKRLGLTNIIKLSSLVIHLEPGHRTKPGLSRISNYYCTVLSIIKIRIISRFIGTCEIIFVS